MNPIQRLFARDDLSTNNAMTPAMFKLLIALLVLVFCGLCLIAGLLIIRSSRRSKQQKQQSELPLYNPPAPGTINHRRLTITAMPYGRHSESIHVYNEKQILMEQSASPPPSPVPEIRITFPEEEDGAGKRKSGRVVVVRVSENGGFGLEPFHEDQLPPYQKSDSDRFQSLDLERMGGLKEKEYEQRWS